MGESLSDESTPRGNAPTRVEGRHLVAEDEATDAGQQCHEARRLVTNTSMAPEATAAPAIPVMSRLSPPVTGRNSLAVVEGEA